MAQEGWICPRCGKVNAPWVPVCSCANNANENNNVGTYFQNGRITVQVVPEFQTVSNTAADGSSIIYS